MSRANPGSRWKRENHVSQTISARQLGEFRAFAEELAALASMLYSEKFTIEGARKRIEQYRKTGALKSQARLALEYETVDDLTVQLQEIIDILDGKAPIENPDQ